MFQEATSQMTGCCTDIDIACFTQDLIHNVKIMEYRSLLGDGVLPLSKQLHKNQSYCCIPSVKTTVDAIFSTVAFFSRLVFFFANRGLISLRLISPG